MDPFLSWLDSSDYFSMLRHAWPWLTVTAFLALTSMIGITRVARRYGAIHDEIDRAVGAD